VLQCVAVCCSVLQSLLECNPKSEVVVCCSVLQCVAVCCSVLQCVPESSRMQSKMMSRCDYVIKTDPQQRQRLAQLTLVQLTLFIAASDSTHGCNQKSKVRTII